MPETKVPGIAIIRTVCFRVLCLMFVPLALVHTLLYDRFQHRRTA